MSDTPDTPTDPRSGLTDAQLLTAAENGDPVPHPPCSYWAYAPPDKSGFFCMKCGWGWSATAYKLREAEAELRRYEGVDQRLMDVVEGNAILLARLDAALAAIRDIDSHATPMGLLHDDDPEGSPAYYHLTVGALHRALALTGAAALCAHVPCERAANAEAKLAALSEEVSQLRTALASAEKARDLWKKASKVFGENADGWMQKSLVVVAETEAIVAAERGLADQLAKTLDAARKWLELCADVRFPNNFGYQLILMSIDRDLAVWRSVREGGAQ